MHRAALRLFVVVGLGLTGCQSPHPAEPSLAGDNTIAFHVGPVDPPRPRYIGHIVATNVVNSDETITVLVFGAVGTPGWITVPKGTTVLAAIKRASGFAGGAGGCVRITRGERQYEYRLTKKSLGPESPGHYAIWFGPEGAGGRCCA